MNNTTSSVSIEAARRPRRVRRWALGLVLLLAILGGLSGYGRTLVAPHPERFAPGVTNDGPALTAIRQTPVAQAFLRDFQTQAHWSSCGPASLRNVLHSLDRPLEHERDLFQGDTAQWLRMLVTGMTLDEVAALAESTGIGPVRVRRDLSEPEFRALLESLSTPGRRLIVNFDRAPIHGVSLGHFSPIGGYEPASDRVLLLDVTPGFGVQLVPVGLLYAAMHTQDPVSGRLRGLIQIDAGPRDD
ncbi:Phytochelatin synthase [Thiorhodococcus drewsii AZ1]|uniref:glutathione gamma-glutamylcysteinyltransferase n=1 Tax=Thiorhodococcus drewsii AZ1 TaxID=765913 RepID=G2E5Q9_9GAMM|nr:phytochelatin synthase family protein [Thiorhodococcus drewsii]EGV28630.1 Phytochelatin synthase [Thiorhodococcus drewsii AZ1]